MCCHMCLKMGNKTTLKYCKTVIGDKQTNSYPSTDHYSYRKAFFEGDYFYETSDQHVLQFFTYSTDLKGNLTCNRAYCEECQAIKVRAEKKSSCIYC